MRNKKLPNLVTLAIMTTVTIISWVAFSVYLALTEKPPPNVPPEILAPVSPEINSNILAEIEERVYFERGGTQAFISSEIEEIEEQEEPEEATGSPLIETLEEEEEAVGETQATGSAETEQ
jgi:hypothetical protein